MKLESVSWVPHPISLDSNNNKKHFSQPKQTIFSPPLIFWNRKILMPRSWDEIILACNLAPFLYLYGAVETVLPLLFTCSCTNLPHIPAKTYSEHLFVNPRGKPLFQGKMILVLSGKAFILCERRIVEGDILPQHFVSPKGTFLNSKYPPWNYNLDVWVNWLWNIRRVIFLPALLIESIRLLPQIPWSLMVLFFQEKFHLVCYTQNLICINLPQ